MITPQLAWKGYSKMFYVQPLTLIYTYHFRQKRYTYRIHLLLTNSTPFKYLVCNVTSLLTIVKSHNGTINSALSVEDE